MGNHSETIEIDYDPTQISYEQLLYLFWTSHRPTRRAWSRQYMSAIFYHNDTQKELAEKVKAIQEEKQGTIYTELLPATIFYLAEDYHQKYMLQQNAPLRTEFAGIYPKFTDFIYSTAVARVNGMVGGYGKQDDVLALLPQLGLSEQGKKELTSISALYK